MRESPDQLCRVPRATIVHTYAGPVSRSAGSLFFAQWSHYVAGMSCVVGSQLEWFRGVLSQDGQRRRTVDSVKLGKALFGLIALHKRRIFWRQGERNWPTLKFRYDWIHRRAYRTDVRPTRKNYPSIVRLYRRGGLVTTIRPRSDIGKRMGACHARPLDDAFTISAVAAFGCNHYDQIRGDSLLLIRVMVVFQLRVFGVGVTFGIVVLLSKYKILTALPLWRHSW